MDFNKLFLVLDELYQFVSNDPTLTDFKPYVWDVREQARAVMEGATSVAPIDPGPVRMISDRAVAAKLVEILARLPLIKTEAETPDTLRLVARLLGNLSTITSAIFSSFPDLVPRSH